MGTSSVCELFGGPSHGEKLDIEDAMREFRVAVPLPSAWLDTSGDEYPTADLSKYTVHYTRVGSTNQFEYIGRKIK